MVALVVVGSVTCGLIIAQAFAITDVVVPVFTAGADLGDVGWPLAILGAVVVARAAAAYVAEMLAFKTAAGAKSELRTAAVRHALALGPSWLACRNSGQITQLVTRGIDGLDAYFARYLPQLILAIIVPATVGVVILTEDPLAAAVVAITIPLIPVFMILIGLHTRRKVERQWRVLGVLSGHFGDVLAGMATLKAFGRARAQASRVSETGEAYRRATMGVLKVSFLSALVLELLAMLSVAMVAVSIGVRLVDGGISLRSGLLVLILVPEVYLPLRQVGMHYHAAAEGLGAAGELADILDERPIARGSRADVPDLATSWIILNGVTVSYPGRSAPALAEVDLVLEPGRVTALVGPSGSGKSTLLALLEGFVAQDSGTVCLESGPGRDDAVDVLDFDGQAWRARIAWVGQEPRLVSGSLADNVRLAAPAASDARVADSLAAVGLAELVSTLPDGVQTKVGEGARRLSAGETRRVAFARVLCSDAQMILLDEPTAALDGTTEDVLLDALERFGAGRTVIVVAHRESLIRRADRVIELREGRVTHEIVLAPVTRAVP